MLILIGTIKTEHSSSMNFWFINEAFNYLVISYYLINHKKKMGTSLGPKKEKWKIK